MGHAGAIISGGKKITLPAGTTFTATERKVFTELCDEFSKTELTAHKIRLLVMLARDLVAVNREQVLLSREGVVLINSHGNAYLTVQGPSLGLYRVWGPFCLGTLTVLMVWLLPAGINSVGADSLSSFLVQLFATLPGFYIAALAATVAFQGGDLDKDMPDTTAVITANNDTSQVEITFRVFLCYLFSYLTALSLVGFGICVVGSLLVPSVESIFAGVKHAYEWIELGYVFILCVVTYGVILCTIQGLYFLAERVHQNLIDEPDDQSPTA